MIVLNSLIVDLVFSNCLFKDNEDTSSAIIVEGVKHKVGFDPIKLNSNIDTINSLIEELPEDFFYSSNGSGMSFLEAIRDKNGNHWGEHHNVDQLLCLGLAIERIKFLLPRDMWYILPGQMPYFQITDAQQIREFKIDNLLNKNE